MTSRSRTLLWLIAGSLGILIVLGWDQGQMITGWGLPTRSAGQMLIVAHRGNMAAWPEDTREAILDAARLGADGIEFDVHQSADGTWWVMHDATVDRTTNGSGRIDQLSDAVLETLVVDAGPGYDPQHEATVHPPTLRDVLEGLSGYGGLLIIDLQHSAGADLDDLLGRLDGRRAVIIARSVEDVAVIHKLQPSLDTLLRIDRIEGDVRPTYAFMEAVSEATVGRVAEEGLPVATYRDGRYGYLADSWVLRRAWAAGVEIYLTDELEPALAWRDDMAELMVGGS